MPVASDSYLGLDYGCSITANICSTLHPPAVGLGCINTRGFQFAHISFVPSVFVAAVLTHTDNCSTAVNRCVTAVSGPDAQCASASSLDVFAVFVD